MVDISLSLYANWNLPFQIAVNVWGRTKYLLELYELYTCGYNPLLVLYKKLNATMTSVFGEPSVLSVVDQASHQSVAVYSIFSVYDFV